MTARGGRLVDCSLGSVPIEDLHEVSRRFYDNLTADAIHRRSKLIPIIPTVLSASSSHPGQQLRRWA